MSIQFKPTLNSESRTFQTNNNLVKPRKSIIPIASPIIGEREIEYVTDAVKSGWVSSIGPYIDKFEEAFASYIGVKHAIAVSNGTVALHLALHGLGDRKSTL